MAVAHLNYCFLFHTQPTAVDQAKLLYLKGNYFNV